jgi:hypothetical protein
MILARAIGAPVKRATGLSTLGGEGQQLLLIDIVNAHGVVILQTIWLVEPDPRAGRRRTDVERIGDQALLLARLRELVPRLFDATAVAVAA